jgi:hypothetical protein
MGLACFPIADVLKFSAAMAFAELEAAVTIFNIDIF